MRVPTAIGWLLTSGLVASPAAAVSPDVQVWVVTEASKEVVKIDDTDPITPLPPPIDLDPGGTEPPPYGIAFSTIEQRAGDWAFVSQGHVIKTISYTTPHTIQVTDVAAALVVSSNDVVLRGVDAARPDEFDDGQGGTLQRSFLHVAADVRVGGAAGNFEPHAIVLDQEALAGLVARPALVHAEPLFPGSNGLEAQQVRVQGLPAGSVGPTSWVQRAWYTVRDNDATPELLARRMDSRPAMPITPAKPVIFIRTLARSIAQSAPLAEGILPAAPHSSELPIVPGASTGQLHHLQVPQSCALSGLEPRVSVVTGPGFGSYFIWTAGIDPAAPIGSGNGVLARSDWNGCTQDLTISIGETPVDVDTFGRVRWQEVYVANRDDDTVTVGMDDGSGGVILNSVAISASGFPCLKCPRSLAVRERPQTVCRAADLRMELINGGDDLQQDWIEIGCEDQVSFRVWCRCLAADPLDCRPSCQCLGADVPNLEHCEVDVDSDGDNQIVTSNGGGSEDDTQDTVTTNDDEGS